jgi:hypothetical protein
MNLAGSASRSIPDQAGCKPEVQRPAYAPEVRPCVFKEDLLARPEGRRSPCSDQLELKILTLAAVQDKLHWCIASDNSRTR